MIRSSVLKILQVKQTVVLMSYSKMIDNKLIYIDHKSDAFLSVCPPDIKGDKVEVWDHPKRISSKEMQHRNSSNK